MDVIVMGLNHRTTPVQIRERFAISEAALPTVAQRAIAPKACGESFVVSTCNRVEIYGACNDLNKTKAHLLSVLAEIGSVSAEVLREHIYAEQGVDAVRHLFRVASSLDSLVIGEPQILGQVKSAYGVCRDEGTTGPLLHRVVERAFAVAKRVRTETGIGRHSVSVSSMAVDLARQIFGDLTECTALLLGAGKMGELAARSLHASGVGTLLVANRSIERAQQVASALGGHPRFLDQIDTLLGRADIVITSTAAPTYLVDVRMMRRVRKARKYRPIFFVDIAVPRNVDPAINALDSVFLYDIDDLSRAANDNLETRLREADEAEAIVTEEAKRLIRQVRGQAAAPTIIALRRKAERLKQVELSRALNRLGELDPKQRKAVETLADGIVNKLLHDVQVGLKRSSAEPGGEHIVEVAQDLFGLDDSPESAEGSETERPPSGLEQP